MAKNFFTKTLLANPDTPVPQYPYMFQKPLSCLQNFNNSETFSVPAALGPDDVNFEVELGVLFGESIPLKSSLTS